MQTASTAAVLVLGGMKVINGEDGFTMGMLVAYQTLLNQFTRPIGSFVQFGSTLQELQADMNRLDDVLRYPEDPQYGTEKKAAAAPAKPGDQPAVARVPARPGVSSPATVKLSGRVELTGVTFGYSPLDKPLIQDFSLVVEPGRRVALIGGSGSGKSTVARLISGLYEPWSGEIRSTACHASSCRATWSSTRWRSSIRRCSFFAGRSAKTSRCGTRLLPRRA